MIALPTPSLIVINEMSVEHSRLLNLKVKFLIELPVLSPSRMMELLFITEPFCPTMLNGMSNRKTLLFTFPILIVSPKLKITSSKMLPSGVKYS